MKADYETAADDLREILKQVSPSFSVIQTGGSDCGERGRQTFAFTVGKDKHEIHGEWSCGSGVALAAFVKERFRIPEQIMFGQSADFLRAAKVFGNVSIHDAAIRYRIRQAYRPDVFDIVSSLLHDAGSVASYVDWTDWAEDFGVFTARLTAEDVRKFQRDFAEIRYRVPILRQILGAHYERALDCASRL